MRADEAALLRSMVALVRQRYGLDDIEAAAYVVDMPSRIKALEAENAALRARAVPALTWLPSVVCDLWTAKVVGFTLSAWNDGSWTIAVGDKLLARGGNGEGLGVAITGCEAAFLRLVGCGNG